MHDFIDKLSVKEVKTLIQKYQELLSSRVHDEEGERALKFLLDFNEELFKLVNWGSKVAESQLYFPNTIKKVRRSLQELYYLEKVMRYAFFLGVMGISLFSIINFLS